MKIINRAIVLIYGLCLGAAPLHATEAPISEDIPVALLVDLSTGQTLFEREAERRFVPASVTKVMTAYTTFKLIDEGALNLDRRYLYPKSIEDEWYGEGSNMFLRAGERPTIGQMLLGITTVSGNDASVAMAVAATGSLDNWLALMNENAEQLGLENTHYGSPNGFPDGGATYTSARDMVALGSAMTQNYPGLYSRFFGHRQLTWRNITQDNHDPITGRVAGADGIKTGFTSEAGYTFLGSAERGGRRLMLIVAGSPTTTIRDDAARAMIEWGFAEFTPQELLEKGAIVGSAQVQDGMGNSVSLRLRDDILASMPSDRERVTLEISYRGPINAPVLESETIAQLHVRMDGKTVLVAPLEAAQSVEQADFFQRVENAIRGWFA